MRGKALISCCMGLAYLFMLCNRHSACSLGGVSRDHIRPCTLSFSAGFKRHGVGASVHEHAVQASICTGSDIRKLSVHHEHSSIFCLFGRTTMPEAWAVRASINGAPSLLLFACSCHHEQAHACNVVGRTTVDLIASSAQGQAVCMFL